MADEVSTLVINVDSGQIDAARKKLDALNKASADSDKATSGLAKGWKAVAGAVTAVVAAVGATAAIKKFASEGIRVQLEWEKARKTLYAVTGNLELATAALDRFNDIDRETVATSEELVNAFSRLVNVGLKPTEKTLRALDNVAIGTNTSLETVATAVAQGAVGMYRGFNQLGIRAEATATGLRMTFRGVSTEIGKDARSIEDYLTKLGEGTFGDAAASQRGTLTFALKNVSNAWDDFVREIMVGQGVGTKLAEWVRAATGYIDDLTKKIKDPDFSLEKLFENFSPAANAVIQTITTVYNTIKGVIDGLTDFWNAGTDDWAEGVVSFGSVTVSTFNMIARRLDIILPAISKVFDYYNESAKAQVGGEKIGRGVLEGTFGKKLEGVTKALDVESKYGFQQIQATTALRVAFERMTGGQMLRLAKGQTTNLQGDLDDPNKMTRTGVTLEDIFPKASQEQLTSLRASLEKAATDMGAFDKQTSKTMSGIVDGMQQLLDMEKGRLDQQILNAKKSRESRDPNSITLAGGLDFSNNAPLADSAYSGGGVTFDPIGAASAGAGTGTATKTTEERMQEAQNQYDLELQMQQDALYAREISTAEYISKSQTAWENYEKTLQAIGGRGNKALQQIYLQRATDVVNTAQNITSALGSVFEEGSKAQKAAFLANQAITVAGIIVSTMGGAAKALEAGGIYGGVMAGLVIAQGMAYAAAAGAQTAQGLKEHEHGGMIPAGSYGIVGEAGAEIVRGPANITSAARTRELMGGATGNDGTVVNVIIQNNMAGAEVETREQETEEGKQIEVIIKQAVAAVASDISQGSGQVSRSLSGAYGLARRGT